MELPVIDATASYSIDEPSVRQACLDAALRLVEAGEITSREVFNTARSYEIYITTGVWDPQAIMATLKADLERSEAAAD